MRLGRLQSLPLDGAGRLQTTKKKPQAPLTATDLASTSPWGTAVENSRLPWASPTSVPHKSEGSMQAAGPLVSFRRPITDSTFRALSANATLKKI